MQTLIHSSDWLDPNAPKPHQKVFSSSAAETDHTLDLVSESMFGFLGNRACLRQMSAVLYHDLEPSQASFLKEMAEQPQHHG